MRVSEQIALSSRPTGPAFGRPEDKLRPGSTLQRSRKRISGSIAVACCAPGARCIVAQDARRGDHDPQPPGIRECRTTHGPAKRAGLEQEGTQMTKLTRRALLRTSVGLA